MTKLTTSQVARRLDCAEDTVRSLDALLQPERVGGRGARVYDSTIVEQVAKERATAPSIRRAEIRTDAVKGDALRDLQALCGEAVSARREATDGGPDAASKLQDELAGYLDSGRHTTAAVRAQSVITGHMARKDSPVAARGDARDTPVASYSPTTIAQRLDGIAGARHHVFADGTAALDESARAREAALALAKR